MGVCVATPGLRQGPISLWEHQQGILGNVRCVRPYNLESRMTGMACKLVFVN